MTSLHLPPQASLPEDWDVIVVGAGSAGVAAATAAARCGARTLLLDASPLPGGELISGISLLGCLSTRGEWIVGGVVTELLDRVKALGGYIGPVFDYRALHLVCFDTELMKIAVTGLLADAGVRTLMPAFVFGFAQDAQGASVRAVHKGAERWYRARVVIDCSGDGDVSVMAGAGYEQGGAGGVLQPPTLMYRVCGVESARLLDFVRQHPEHFGLGDYPGLGMDARACAEALHRQGLPKVLLRGTHGLLKDAIASGEMYPTSVLAIVPTSLARKEVSINSTQLAGVDGTRAESVSAALAPLMAQVKQGLDFLRRRLPGFEQAQLAAVAPRIGIRETRRILGDYVLSGEDILHARKRADGIAKGGHELDILGVKDHRHETIAQGGSYDIPLECLIPRGQTRLLMAGRCISSTREAQSSARVMGTCMATGQAAGTAAALCDASPGWDGDVRSVDRTALRRRLLADGAILEGTH
ncbi:FAD-dependent oxidoreductase [Ramlibacter sp. G-1-2-2]|uniref:FAD-dependent oxidoreductase n=1 Tax=Ramlibacter agri TaxID=2728837 RepID=A0A848HAA0_9BURK|nr:FAD-dependent oxidoreductase [Ramlibacter agri]NML47397.1 FAD-dependent oxidoreductase [Ramlibacter agri]